MATERFAGCLFLFLLLFGLISCDNSSRRRNTVARVIRQVQLHEAEWNTLTQNILSDSYVRNRINMYIRPEELPKNIQNELTTRGVVRLTVNNTECKEVEYTTNWTDYPIGTLYLTWTTCDSVQTKQGYYHDYYSKFIEVWGLGNNWLIWVDSDFI